MFNWIVNRIRLSYMYVKKSRTLLQFDHRSFVLFFVFLFDSVNILSLICDELCSTCIMIILHVIQTWYSVPI